MWTAAAPHATAAKLRASNNYNGKGRLLITRVLSLVTFAFLDVKFEERLLCKTVLA